MDTDPRDETYATDGSTGMRNSILNIKLAMNTKRWDVMVERMNEHLKAAKESKMVTKQKYILDEEE